MNDDHVLQQLAREDTVPALLDKTAHLLVESLHASACTISRAIGDLLVDLVDYSSSGAASSSHSYLISDFPLTQAVLEGASAHSVWVGDTAADPREATLLRRLGFDSLIMARMDCNASAWGLVEVYDNRPGGFTADELARAERIIGRAGAELTRLSAG